jgi:hypothetical protein
MTDTRITEAVELMTRFAERTGLTLDVPGRRYFWTDALACASSIASTRSSACDDGRQGWLSGLPDPEARAHPTRGGLRIGKAVPERMEGEPVDPELEWDRDGQYFHYLTKWIHALDQAARSTGDASIRDKCHPHLSRDGG